MHYLYDLINQRTVLYIAIGAVSICVILIVLGFIFPKGIPTGNSSPSPDSDRIVKTIGGVTSEYSASQAIDFVKAEIQSENLGNPICSTDQGKFVAFFSHRKYWKVAFSCPPDPEQGIHASPEYLYEFSEWDKTIKHTPLK